MKEAVKIPSLWIWAFPRYHFASFLVMLLIWTFSFHFPFFLVNSVFFLLPFRFFRCEWAFSFHFLSFLVNTRFFLFSSMISLPSSWLWSFTISFLFLPCEYEFFFSPHFACFLRVCGLLNRRDRCGTPSSGLPKHLHAVSTFSSVQIVPFFF